MYYPDLVDTISSSANFLVAVRKGSYKDHSPICITYPPITQPNSIESFI